MTKTKQKTQNKNRQKALLFSFFVLLAFSASWGFLYYFLALPNYLGAMQYIIAYLIFKHYSKTSKNCHLWLVLWCLALNFLTLFVAIIIGIYAETNNFWGSLVNFCLLINNSKLFRINLIKNIIVIAVSIIAGCCLIMLYYKAVKIKTNQKEKLKKEKQKKQEIDHFINLFTQTKQAIETFLESKNEQMFKHEIFNVEQQIANLNKESLSKLKLRLEDAIYMPYISQTNTKALTILKKIVDKY